MNIQKIITVFFLLIAFSLSAQDKKEQIKALKVAFFTTELSLTTAEAEKFWPVYNDYEDKQFDYRFKKMRVIKRKLENLDGIDEKEAQSLLTQFENAEDELHQSRKKLVQSLRTFLPAVKILRLKKAEDDFNRKLLRQYKENRSGKRE